VQRSFEAAEMAAKAGVQLAYEFHRNTYTETMEEALKLLKAFDHPNLQMYWQPTHGSGLEPRLREIEAFKQCLLCVHVFNWEGSEKPPYARLALSEGSELWRPCLDAIAKIPGERFALLEFVRGNCEKQFREDAQTLIDWIQ
jgi:sugar phosphate isomerase/epimerase